MLALKLRLMIAYSWRQATSIISMYKGVYFTTLHTETLYYNGLNGLNILLILSIKNSLTSTIYL